MGEKESRRLVQASSPAWLGNNRSFPSSSPIFCLQFFGGASERVRYSQCLDDKLQFCHVIQQLWICSWLVCQHPRKSVFGGFQIQLPLPLLLHIIQPSFLPNWLKFLCVEPDIDDDCCEKQQISILRSAPGFCANLDQHHIMRSECYCIGVRKGSRFCTTERHVMWCAFRPCSQGEERKPLHQPMAHAVGSKIS